MSREATLDTTQFDVWREKWMQDMTKTEQSNETAGGIEAMPVERTDFDPFAPAHVADPSINYEKFKTLRQGSPVKWLSKYNVWAVFRDEIIREVLSDPEKFGSAGGGGLANYYRETPWREPSVMFETDPPDHTRIRRVLARILSPKAVRELEQVVAVQAAEAASDIVRKGEFDALHDFVKPFIMKIVPDAVGLPDADRENVLIYRKYMVRGRGPNRAEPLSPADQAECDEVVAWINEMCNRDKLLPGGYGEQVYEACDRGEITEREANLLIRGFLSAGSDTTFGTITNTLYFLTQNPAEMHKLIEDPDLARSALEEGMRYQSIGPSVSRDARTAMNFHGAEMAEHDKILLFVSSANRDPDRWDNPDAFNISRNATGHLTLSMGIHGCIGQMIVRMEGTHLLRELFKRIEHISVNVPTDKLTWGEHGVSLNGLPVSVREKATA